MYYKQKYAYAYGYLNNIFEHPYKNLYTVTICYYYDEMWWKRL